MGNKRLILIVVFCAVISGYFWSQSRVPALNAKAEMGGELLLDDPLAFDVIVVVDPLDPLLTKIAYTSVNWAYTNWKGMTFGILIGAALMVLFSLLVKRSYKNPVLNSALGIVIGAPLGVCVNCATPIAQGLYSAGARLETMLATMMSSPTTNVIVLTMLFSMFPPYFIVIKLGLTLMFLLIGIPLVARYFAKPSNLTIDEDSCPIDLIPAAVAANESWLAAGGWVARSYFTNLWWVLRKTGPLMLLAGVAGAAAIHILPWDSVVNLFEGRGGALYDFIGEFGVAVVGLGIVSTLGVWLPVPMTFDLIIVATLLSAGMPVHYAMALLFTLGIFSVYPFMIIWRDVSRRVAFGVAGVLIIFGVLSGLTAREYDLWDRGRRSDLLLQAFGEKPPAPPAADSRPSLAIEALGPQIAAARLAPESMPASGELQIERFPFAARKGDAGPLFAKREAMEFGIDEPYQFSLSRFVRPWSYHRPIAAGDVHGDGWVDVVLPGEGGAIALYTNVGGSFVRQQVELPSLKGSFIGLLALVDLDDDDSLDLYVTTYRHGNYVIYGDHGDFREENLRRLPSVRDQENLTASSSFGDIDRDGDLDIVLGNWARWQKLPQAQNALLLANGREYVVRLLEDEIVGETLTTLFSDWNADGKLDLIIGNEGQPSFFYLGDGAGGLTMVGRDVIPYAPKTAMDLASADIDNDLLPEIYMGQITGRDTQGGHLLTATPEEACEALADAATRKRCELDTADFQVMRRSYSSRDTRRCLEINNEVSRDTCLAYHTLGSADWARDPSFCEYLPERWSDLATQCRARFETPISYSEEDYRRAVGQIKNDNVLLTQTEPGRFVDRAKEQGLALAGWTWNGKFADLDNDGWKDMFIVNGIFETKSRETKVLYLNQQGKGFRNATQESGVEDFFPTSGYVYIDFDRDGDLDVITAPVHGPVWLYENHATAGNSIAFELRDQLGNSQGIGSKIVIRHGDDKQQMWEIQSGGGFISFDPLIAHFGLADDSRATQVEVQWSTGERSVLAEGLTAGATYRITRPAAIKVASTSGPR